MKILKYFVLGAAVLGLASCHEVDVTERDQATRVTLSPLTTEFAAEASTYVAAVQINSGSYLSDMAWEAEITSATPWATVSKTTVEDVFVTTYDKVTHTQTLEGIEVAIAANSEYMRTFTLTITAADGTVVPFTFTQLGAKADAAVSTSVKNVEFLAAGGEQVVEYTTNMGDVVSFAFTNGDGTAATWLAAEAVEVGKVKVTAQPWDNKEAGRNATMTITVGTATTSTASISIPVAQLAAEDHYFVYGASVADIAIANALQMTKTETVGVYTLKTFFNESDNNAILINKDSRELTYPCWALAADGKVAKIEAEGATYTAHPVEANGVRTLTVNFNDLTWSWARETNEFAMPDELIKDYPTKAYIARDGSMKVWMVKHMAWDGGNISPKLGSGMVKDSANGSAGSGGYAQDVFPSAWNDWTKLNPAFETKENEGKGQLETYSDDGRVYTFHEMVGAEARNGIGYARYEEAPNGWREGDKITDARGITYTVKKHKIGAGAFTGDNAADEAENPMLKIQAQGICPYGWHIANPSDWVDLGYAMSQASEGHTHPVSAADCTYKVFTETGIPNMGCWLRNTKDYQSGPTLISDGADEFGFDFYPLGYRYMTQGFQNWSQRIQVWIPYQTTGTKKDYTYSTCRLNVIINTNHDNPGNTNTFTNFDIGQAVAPFRCVKNYK